MKKKVVIRIASLLFTAALVLGLAACSGKGASDKKTAEKAPAAEAAAAAEEKAENKAEKKTEEPVKEPPKSELELLVERAASMQNYEIKENGMAEPISAPDDNILVLVNKTHPVTEDYKAGDMVTVSRYDSSVGSDETHRMRKTAADALELLMDGAKESGYNIVLRTGYRSYGYQKSLYSSYVEKHGQAEADRFSARPGTSEHQTGWCCDVGIPGVYLTAFTGTDEAKWIEDHAHDYGFILRYPEGKEDITGYMYESWHIRYVGKPAADEIYSRGITLEELLNQK